MDRNRIARKLLTTAAFFFLLLFLPAGTFAWRQAWIFLAITAATILTSTLTLAWLNPEIFVVRQRVQPGTKQWDRVLLALLFPAMSAIFIVASLDSGRFHWSTPPAWTSYLGYGLYFFGFALFTFAQTVNRFFEPGVRIQTERGHHVIDRGPYRFIRHPGYVGACTFMIGSALALGSLWALVPSACTCLLLLIRTKREDQTLRAELPGYDDYAQRVRFRWLPGLW